VEQQQQLFGARPGPVARADLTVVPPMKGQLGRAVFLAETYMRERPMRLTLSNLPPERMATAVGYLVPLVMMAHHVGAPTLRARMHGVARTVGIAGWEFDITGCGRP
jgi:hypothetical protein